MVFAFGMDLPVMEMLILLDLILFVYLMIVLFQVSKINSIRLGLEKQVQALDAIVRAYVKSDVVLWTAERLSANVPEATVLQTLETAGYSNFEEIVRKAKALKLASGKK